MSSIELVAKLKAVDEASDKIRRVGDNVEKAMNKVEGSVEKAEFSFKKFTTSISGVMTAGFNLYNLYDRIDDAQLSVKKAQDSLTAAQLNAKDAQDAYNRVIEKYGEDSEEAKEALDELKLAQERVATAQESLKDKQDRVNEAMVQMAIQAVPTAITMLTNLKGTVHELSAAFNAAKVSVAGFSGVGGLGALSLGIGGAAAAMGIFYIGWNEDWDGIRTKTENTINEIKKYLDDLGNYLNSFIPNLDGLVNGFTSAFDGIGSYFSDLVSDINSELNDIIESFQNAYNEIIGHSIWPEMWNNIEKIAKKDMSNILGSVDRGLDELERMSSKPIVMQVGLSMNVSPMRAELESMVSGIINKQLKSVIIEATSASGTTKRIRVEKTISTRGNVPFLSR